MLTDSIVPVAGLVVAVVALVAGVGVALWQQRAPSPQERRQNRYESALSALTSDYGEVSNSALEYHIERMTDVESERAAALSRKLGLLADPDWIPRLPADAASLTLEFEGTPARSTPSLGGFAHVLPSSSLSGHLSSSQGRNGYLFDAPTYHLTGLSLGESGLTLRFGITTYFEFLDTNRSLAVEYASAYADGGSFGRRQIPRRHALQDVTNVGDVLHPAAVTTLLLRLPREPGSGATFYYLQRNESLAHSAKLIGLVPSGMFQPASAHPDALVNDLSILRNVQREFAEELLGYEELREPSPYIEASSAFIDLDDLLDMGLARLYFLGVGLDPLTLVAEIMTALVMTDEAFELVLSDRLEAHSSEGLIPMNENLEGLPFPESVDRLLAESQLGACAGACLRLAVGHSDLLLRPSEAKPGGI